MKKKKPEYNPFQDWSDAIKSIPLSNTRREAYVPFRLVQALCRCALVDATEATRHQVKRIQNELRGDEMLVEVQLLEELLNPRQEDSDMKIVQSPPTPPQP